MAEIKTDATDACNKPPTFEDESALETETEAFKNDLPQDGCQMPLAKEPTVPELLNESISNLTEAADNLVINDDGRNTNKEPEKLSEVDKTLVIIEKYLSMAVKEKETSKASTLLKDKYISEFLVLALLHDSGKVIVAAMEVFEVFVSTRRNHSILQSLPYFMAIIENISKNSELPAETANDAKQMLKILKEKPVLGEQSMSMRNTDEKSIKGRSKDTMPKPYSTLTRPKQPTGRETIFVLRPGVLQMHYNRTNIEQHLIKVPGIISLTYNLGKNHCIIRGKRHVASEVFGIAIANLGFEVSLLSKNEKHEETLIPITPDLKELSSKENLPGYLPEDYEDIQGPVADNAICSKDLTNPDGNKDGSIFSSAMKFVKKSFYW